MNPQENPAEDAFQSPFAVGIAEPIPGLAPEDPDETLRRALQLKVNSEAAERAGLEARHGRVWNTAELAAEFTVLDFQAPFVVVRRKSDQKLGSLYFQHRPRFYFLFKEDE